MSRTNNELWDELKGFIEAALQKTGVPGCSVGILHQGETRVAGFGLSNVEKLSPVSADTLFQIGSITKTFTATVVMKLVEENRLDLHLPVRNYLPDFKVADETVSAQVTPYHLLTHSAGWDGDLFLETGDGADAIQKYIQRMDKREQLTPLGEYFSYNNSGFAVLGGIIEAVTQKPLEEIFRSYILNPIGMEHTHFNAGETITYDFAVGHNLSPDGPRVARPWRMQRNVLPMGAIITNAGDLLKYAQCYLADGKTPSGTQELKPETIGEMFTPKVPISKEDRSAVGFSWMRRDLESGYVVEHGGGTNGQVTLLSLAPERDFALAFFTNSGNGGALIEKVQKFVLKNYLGFDYPSPQEIPSTPQQLSAYAGTGWRPGVNVYLDMLGDHLVGLVQYSIGFPTENDPPPPPNPPFRVGRCAEDRLMILDGEGKGAPIDIFRDAQGKIKYFRANRLYQFEPKLS